jgi:hypothetical protein
MNTKAKQTYLLALNEAAAASADKGWAELVGSMPVNRERVLHALRMAFYAGTEFGMTDITKELCDVLPEDGLIDPLRVPGS